MSRTTPMAASAGPLSVPLIASLPERPPTMKTSPMMTLIRPRIATLPKVDGPLRTAGNGPPSADHAGGGPGRRRPRPMLEPVEHLLPLGVPGVAADGQPEPGPGFQVAADG